MMNPIQFDEILDRVSGNREFVIQMLDLFFETSRQRLSVLRKDFDDHNYADLAEEAHKLKGLIGNLSITKAFSILKDLHEAANQRNDQRIDILLNELDESILEAKAFYQTNSRLTY